MRGRTWRRSGGGMGPVDNEQINILLPSLLWQGEGLVCHIPEYHDARALLGLTKGRGVP